MWGGLPRTQGFFLGDGRVPESDRSANTGETTELCTLKGERKERESHPSKAAVKKTVYVFGKELVSEQRKEPLRFKNKRQHNF